uniref:Small ribosomal subunit protein uS3m n=1 Tax=Monosporozyma servazzii TaxID=27293 RepID=RMAR_MONSE|nr:var1 ribosomal protein [Kazachstania servazzii]Q7YEV0.1 RecName: Full=Small ribosomal subunit protein uS3m; AltName: Full=Ribosomal protein VAR1, mitochondrial [Kazachstania servazzii]CAD23422.1 var1 ribosomal protein [Kazachstania servazzii]
MKMNLMKMMMNNDNNNKLLNKVMMINNNNNNKLSNKVNTKQLNNNNQWSMMMYNYNKNNELNNIMNNNMMIQLLYKMMNMVNGNKMFISKPQFKININSVVIKFYYYNMNNNNNHNEINNMMMRLSKVLSYYYNKEVMIKPIKMSYVYMDSNIFTDYIMYLLTNNNNMNMDKIMNSYMNMFSNIMPLNINNQDKNVKYLSGWSIMLKGKLSDGRSKMTKMMYGSFNNNNKNYDLNNMPNNMYKGSVNPLNLNINKDGKYNIKVKLNYNK